jgi:pimeloyl-ACP methyl ester carboxylesterase
MGCAAEGAPVEEAASSTELLWESDPLPARLLAALQEHAGLSDAELDRVYHLDHYVWIGRNRRIHVTESFTLRSWLSWPHRATLLIPGYPANAEFYNLDVDGYRFQDRLAQQGYFAFAADYEGSGLSTYPENGLDANHERAVDAMGRVVSFIRLVRLVPRVDVLGESNGGAVAAELCADARSVRSCVLASMTYEELTPFAQAAFLDPGFIGFLLSQPNGYLDATPDLFFNIIGRASPEVAAEILATQPGTYAVAPFLEFTGVPFFDPTGARVPALILQGTEDNVATQADSDALAAAYGSVGGGSATVVRIAGGGHIPRIEPSPVSDQWTAAVLDFLAAP